MNRGKQRFSWHRDKLFSQRAQMEMIGLVFVVVLIVVGIILYLTLSDRVNTSKPVQKDVQYSTSFRTALAETEIPECQAAVTHVAYACITQDLSYCNSLPCEALQRAMDAITEETLKRQGIKYNLSLDQTSVQSISGCDSGNKTTGVFYSDIPIPNTPSKITLSICR